MRRTSDLRCQPKRCKRALQTYQKNGKITQVFLGVRYMPITADVQKNNNLKYDYGILVVRGQNPSDLAVIQAPLPTKRALGEMILS